MEKPVKTYYWEAYKGITTDDDLNSAYEKTRSDISLVQLIASKIEDDDYDESSNIVLRYMAASDEQRAFLDDFLVLICGFTMHSLVEML